MRSSLLNKSKEGWTSQLEELLSLASQAHDQQLGVLYATKGLQDRLQSMLHGRPEGPEDKAVPSERTPIRVGDYVVPTEVSQVDMFKQSTKGPTLVITPATQRTCHLHHLAAMRASDVPTASTSYVLVNSLDSAEVNDLPSKEVSAAAQLCVQTQAPTPSEGSSLPTVAPAKVLRTSLAFNQANSLGSGTEKSFKRVNTGGTEETIEFESDEAYSQRATRRMDRIQSMHRMRNLNNMRDTGDTLGLINKLFGHNPMHRPPTEDQDYRKAGYSLGKDGALQESGSLDCDSSSSLQLQALARALNTGQKSTQAAFTGFELRPVWQFDSDLDYSVDAEESLMYKKIKDGLASSLGLFLRRSSVSSGFSRRVPRVSSDSNMSQEVIRSKTPGIRYCIMHPSSPKRAFWDTLGIFMICFDIFTLPLTAFEPEETWFFTFMGWASQLFWNFDIIASFFTGYVKDGIAVMVPGRIFQHYLKHWFVFDVTIVGVDWLLYVVVNDTEKSTASATRVSKMSRMLRFLRTIRLLKVFKINAAQDILEEVFDVFASESAYTQLSIVKIMICILCINHFVACIWYAIGNADGGWVHKNDISGAGIIHRYACSYHWSVSQFGVGNVGIEAKSTAEHIFSVVVLLCALVLFSCLVSSATNALARYQQNRTDELRQFGLFRRFCRQIGIPRQLTKRALNYLEYESRMMQRNIDHNEVGLLARLSAPLVAELMYYKYLPHMQTNPLLEFLCREGSLVMHKVAIEALFSKMGGRNDVMLSFGHQADEVFYVMHGELQYSWHQQFEHRREVKVGQWVGEPSLWTMWLHLGDLIATAGIHLLVVDVVKFGEAIKKNPELWATVVMYAGAFVQHLKNTPVNLLTDIRGYEEVYHFEELFEKTSRRKKHRSQFSGPLCLARFRWPCCLCCCRSEHLDVHTSSARAST